MLDLSSASPIYSSAGALQKLTLDGSAMSLAQATDVLDGLQFHVASLTGLSLSGAIQPGGSTPEEGFMQSLGSLLQASKALSVLDLSDCALELDALPAATKAPLQVLNLGGNSVGKSAANINSLAGSVAKTLQLLSLRGCSVAAGISPTIGNGLTGLDACIDLSGLQMDWGRTRQVVSPEDITSCVELGASAPQTLVLRDIMPQQVNTVLTAMTSSNVQDLDIRPAGGGGAQMNMAVQLPAGVFPGQQMVVQSPSGQQMSVVVPAGVMPGGTFQIAVPAGGADPAPIGAVLGSSSSLTSLNISRCGLGAHLYAATISLPSGLHSS